MIMLIVLSMVESQVGLYIAMLMLGLSFSGIMPCYPSIIQLLFPAIELGWRVATQYLFAVIGMAFGGWLVGAIFDLTGSYSQAFLTGAGFNFVNIGLVELVRSPIPTRHHAASGLGRKPFGPTLINRKRM